MRHWIFPADLAAFDILTAFAKLHRLDWRKNCTARQGDFVFIYAGKPVQKIVLKAVIERDQVPRSEMISDEDFSKLLKPDYNQQLANTAEFFRLKPVASYLHLDEEFNLETLRRQGLVKNIQGPHLLENNDDLCQYVLAIDRQIVV